jgi:MFS family permease
MLDSTVVNVARPALGADLGASLGGLQLVVNGYTLSLAALILLGGSLGDQTSAARQVALLASSKANHLRSRAVSQKGIGALLVCEPSFQWRTHAPR